MSLPTQDMKPASTSTAPAVLLNANQIAIELGRQPSSVIDKIASLGIAPSHQSGKRRFYSPEVLETLRDAMRAPNRKPAEPITTGN